MGRFARSWELGKTCWRVLRQDKELMLLPLFGGIATLGIGAVVLPVVAVMGEGRIVVAFLGIIAAAIVVYFFQGALVYGARERLTGGDPTVRSSLRGAWGRIGVIIGWAFLAVVVGAIIRAIESALRDRSAILAALVGSLLDMAWSVLTFLAMPIIIVEGVGPFRALGRSKELLRSTWGENLIAHVGMSVVGFVLMMPGILIALLLGTGPLGLIGVVVGGLLAVLGAIVTAALSGIYQTALYEYATTFRAPAQFAEVNMGASFGQRSSNWGGPGNYRT